MKNRIYLSLSSLCIVSCGCLQQNKTTAPDLDATLDSIHRHTGQAYVVFRDHLLSMSPEIVKPELQTLIEETEDPIDQLVWEAILLRLKDLQGEDDFIGSRRFTKVELNTAHNVVELAIAEARACASHIRDPAEIENSFILALRDSEAGTLRFMDYLGNSALSIATELITKHLTDEWEPWERCAILQALKFFGSRGYTRTKEGAYLYRGIRDPRGGWVLLWIAEHDSDVNSYYGKNLPRVIPRPLPYPSAASPLGPAGLAAVDLNKYPDTRLLDAAQALHDQTDDYRRRRVYRLAIQHLEHGLRKIDGKRTPSTSPHSE